MSSALEGAERFIAGSGFDRAPWLTVAFGSGIAAWFSLPMRWQWLALIAGALGVAISALLALREDGRFPFIRQAMAALAIALAAGCATVWIKSAFVGTPGISRPVVTTVAGIVLSRQDQPADKRTRLVLAIRDPQNIGKVLRVRVNVPLDHDSPTALEGATVRMKVRLMPPAPPMLPGSYDFARQAWFDGVAATGTALSGIEILSPGAADGLFAPLRHFLSNHIHKALSGSPGGVAAAFAAGDRGGIAESDETAMRDAGLTHLLSVSGLHVSAVIGATYLIVLRLLALWPWLALRVRLPLFAAGSAALAGIFYTVLTGSEVPTVRSVVGALLVLVAVALGREPLSLRLLAITGFCVMLLWPEAVVGPSFQLSFGAVLAIVSVHGTGWLRAMSAPREESWWARGLRHVCVLLITGLVIELSLMPIGLFHFHRAGIYGSIANVIAIPLTTFVTMPLIALALLMDVVGVGAPAWWAVGKSVELLLGLAQVVAAQPGAVTLLPEMGAAAFATFLIGGLWLALWTGQARLLGLLPISVGAIWLLFLRAPDVLVSGDGHHVGFVSPSGEGLIVLRDSRSEFARDKLAEMAGMDGEFRPLDQWPGARCNDDFCTVVFERGGREWHFLLSRGNNSVPLRDLAAACERVDIVISDRRLPYSCRPAALKADRALLAGTGGLALDLSSGRIATVAGGQGEHGWWKAAHPEQPHSAGRTATSPASAAPQ